MSLDSIQLIEDQTQVFTAREREVLACISKGQTDKEIARELNISAHTVANHVRNMSRKMGGARRAALITHAWSHSVI
jgi:DNA-binding CsgD family transcriptional regulator